MGRHVGDLVVTGDIEISGQVTGTTHVRAGGRLLAHGQLAGGLIIDQGGEAVTRGQVARNVVNNGRLTLLGQVAGRVVGNLPINAMGPNQIVGTDLEVPFRCQTYTYSTSRQF